MLSVRGIYENGQVRLIESVNYPKRAHAVVNIIEEMEPESQKTKKMINGYITEDIINETETIENNFERSAITDTSEEFLSEEELNYYFNLEALS